MPAALRIQLRSRPRAYVPVRPPEALLRPCMGARRMRLACHKKFIFLFFDWLSVESKVVAMDDVRLDKWLWPLSASCLTRHLHFLVHWAARAGHIPYIEFANGS